MRQPLLDPDRAAAGVSRSLGPLNGTARSPRARVSRSHLLPLIAMLVAIAAFVAAVVLATMLAFTWFAFVGRAAG